MTCLIFLLCYITVSLLIIVLKTLGDTIIAISVSPALWYISVYLSCNQWRPLKMKEHKGRGPLIPSCPSFVDPDQLFARPTVFGRRYRLFPSPDL